MLENKELDLEAQIEACINKYFNNNIYQDAFEKLKKEINSHTNEGMDEYQYPLFLNWIITGNCNLRCKHCYYYNNENKYDFGQDLSTELAMKVIEDIEKLNVINVVLTGGEALLREDIFGIIEKLKSKNLSVRLSTNATLITKQIAEKLSALLNPLTDSIQVSLDGAKASTHEKIRGKGTFEKTIQGIKNLIGSGFIPYINCTVTSNNIFELTQMYDLSAKLGVQKLSLAKFLPRDESHQNLRPDRDILFREIAKIVEMEKQGNGPFFEMQTFKIFDFASTETGRKILDKRTEDFKMLMEDLPCNYSCHKNAQISIQKDGKIYPCFRAADIELFCFGNIQNNSLSDIWESRHNSEFFKPRPVDKMPCSKCTYFPACRGGCSLEMYQEHGTLLIPDNNCIKGKFLIKNLYSNKFI